MYTEEQYYKALALYDECGSVTKTTLQTKQEFLYFANQPASRASGPKSNKVAKILDRKYIAMVKCYSDSLK